MAWEGGRVGRGRKCVRSQSTSPSRCRRRSIARAWRIQVAARLSSLMGATIIFYFFFPSHPPPARAPVAVAHGRRRKLFFPIFVRGWAGGGRGGSDYDRLHARHVSQRQWFLSDAVYLHTRTIIIIIYRTRRSIYRHNIITWKQPK